MTSFVKGLKRLPLIIRDISPLLISHHPLCRYFDQHMVRIGRLRICLGCATIYPTFLAALLLMFALRDSFAWIHPAILLVVGLAPVFLKAVKIENKVLKIFINVIVAVGMAIALLGIYWLPIHWIFRILILLALLFVTSFVYAKRFDRHIAKCKKECKYKRDWSRCPGLKKIHKNLDKDLDFLED